jgi:hypothetical protein
MASPTVTDDDGIHPGWLSRARWVLWAMQRYGVPRQVARSTVLHRPARPCPSCGGSVSCTARGLAIDGWHDHTVAILWRCLTCDAGEVLHFAMPVPDEWAQLIFWHRSPTFGMDHAVPS